MGEYLQVVEVEMTRGQVYRVCVGHHLRLAADLKVFLAAEYLVDALAIEASNQRPVLPHLVGQNPGPVFDLFPVRKRSRPIVLG